MAAALAALSFETLFTCAAEADFFDFPQSSPTNIQQSHPGRRHLQAGLATWYGPGFHGRRTASGERFNAGAMTAAHRSLPFGSQVEVINEATGRSVVVRINDRGPHRRGAVIDLSHASAAAIGMSGTTRVRLVSLDAE